MFDFLFEFFYNISKSIYRLIDGMMSCANKLCGLDTINVNGNDITFLDYVFSNDRFALAFKTAAILGMLLVAIFSVFGIIRSVVSEKSGETPAQVAVKTAKTILTFLFVPACMIVFMAVTNMFMEAMYAATLGGSSNGIGNFLCGAFGQDALHSGTDPAFYLEPGFDYLDEDALWKYLDLSDYDFFFSWIAGICILFSLARTLLIFVDRAISLVILFIVSPFSISTTVIDDGAHFKLWRDQVLVKFLTGYGCIIALNVYTMIISLISSNTVVFYEGSSFLNNLLKIAFILGGSVSMYKAMALIGNLISAGAGSNEMRENAMANAAFRGAASKLTAPFSGLRSASNFIRDSANHGFISTVGNRLGFKTDRDYGIKSQTQQEKETESKKREHAQLADFIGNSVAKAISGKDTSAPASGNNGNAPGISGNSNDPVKNNEKKNDAVMNAINNQDPPDYNEKK